MLVVHSAGSAAPEKSLIFAVFMSSICIVKVNKLRVLFLAKSNMHRLLLIETRGCNTCENRKLTFLKEWHYCTVISVICYL